MYVWLMISFDIIWRVLPRRMLSSLDLADEAGLGGVMVESLLLMPGCMRW